MGIESIGDGLKTELEKITGLRVFAPKELPDTINELPAAVILPGPVNYDSDFDADYDFTFRVVILLAKQDSPSAFGRILDYIEQSGSSSVWAKVEAAPTLGGTCESARVTVNRGIGGFVWGGIEYLSTEFEVAISAAAA